MNTQNKPTLEQLDLNQPYGRNVCCVCLDIEKPARKITWTEEMRERTDGTGEVVIPEGRHWIHHKCKKLVVRSDDRGSSSTGEAR